MKIISDKYKYLNNTRFCMIYMSVIDLKNNKLKLVPIYGIANVLSDRIVLSEDNGKTHVIPTSALPSILPSDGNEILKDSAHYVIVKIAKK